MAIRITPLEIVHAVQNFDCSSPELNEFLKATAGQHQKKLISKSYVLTNDDTPTEVMGFYTIAIRRMIFKTDLPPDMAKRLPREVPGFTLARLAVRQDLHGQGFGEYLLIHALERTARVAREIGGFALFVDAKDEKAAMFYKKYGFRSLPDNPLILCMPFADMPH